MLIQDSHRSTLLFQLRDWRESLATSPVTGHGLPGEFQYQFIVKEGLILSRCDSSRTLDLDGNLAKDQLFKVRLAATVQVGSWFQAFFLLL